MTANVEPSPIMIKSTAEHHELGELGADSAKCYTKCSKDIQNTVAEPLLPLAIRSKSLPTDQRWQLQKPKNGLHALFWHTSWQLVAHVLTANDTARRSWKGRSHFQGHSHGAYMREGTKKPFPGPLLSYLTGGVLEGIKKPFPGLTTPRAGRANRFRGHSDI